MMHKMDADKTNLRSSSTEDMAAADEEKNQLTKIREMKSLLPTCSNDDDVLLVNGDEESEFVCEAEKEKRKKIRTNWFDSDESDYSPSPSRERLRGNPNTTQEELSDSTMNTPSRAEQTKHKTTKTPLKARGQNLSKKTPPGTRNVRKPSDTPITQRSSKSPSTSTLITTVHEDVEMGNEFDALVTGPPASNIQRDLSARKWGPPPNLQSQHAINHSRPESTRPSTGPTCKPTRQMLRCKWFQEQSTAERKKWKEEKLSVKPDFGLTSWISLQHSNPMKRTILRS